MAETFREMWADVDAYWKRSLERASSCTYEGCGRQLVSPLGRSIHQRTCRTLSPAQRAVRLERATGKPRLELVKR